MDQSFLFRLSNHARLGSQIGGTAAPEGDENQRGWNGVHHCFGDVAEISDSPCIVDTSRLAANGPDAFSLPAVRSILCSGERTTAREVNAMEPQIRSRG